MSQKELVQKLISENVLITPEIINAFKKIDRADFVLPKYFELAYLDIPLSINHNQTISQPSTVAFMLELLKPKKGDKILDIGSGSGWTTALLSELVGKKGYVFGVEKISELVDFGRDNLSKYHLKNAEILPADFVLGLDKEAPFDKILVSASAEKLPKELLNQLKNDGRLVVPVQNSIWLIDKISKKDLKMREYYGFIFVPLVK